MAAANTRLVNLPDPLRRRLEALLLNFEGSWTPQHFAARAAEVGQLDAELRLPALTEMAKVDLELQWRHGNRLRIEDYLARHPELGTADTVPPDLIQAEFEVRQQFGEPASLPDFERRFPRHADRLRRLLGRPSQGAAPAAMPDTFNQPAGKPPSQPTAPHYVGDLPAEFGSYRILQRLGQGGMGAVYLAQDTKLNRPVAIKVTLDRDPELLARLREEALAAAKLLHPNICPVYEFGEAGGVHYIALAYIEGTDLAKSLKASGPLPADQVARLVGTLAKALQYAHEHGVIHRDLKPSNILMNTQGEPVILDFGLARQLNRSEDRLTVDGRILGTPAYMAPEQVRGRRDAIDHRCDIYALGVILYELLAGRLPFSGHYPELLNRVLTEEPEPPSQHRPDVDRRLEAVCLKAMARRPEDRYPSMRELAAALEPPAPLPPVPKAPGRRRFTGTLVAGVVGVSLLVTVAILAGVFRVRTADGSVLVLEVNEPDADVFVDGERVTVTWAPGGKKVEVAVQPGTRTVEVKRDGFEAFGEKVEVKEGKRLLRVTLIPAPKPVAEKKDVKEPVAAKAPAPAVADDGYVSLFNGKDLSGWERSGAGVANAFWTVEGGALVGRSKGREATGALHTRRKDYQNYRFRIETALVEGREGVGEMMFAVRGTQDADSREDRNMRIGALIGSGAVQNTGMLITGGQTRIKVKRQAQHQIRAYQRFTQEVVVEGTRVRVYVNDVLTSQYDFPRQPRPGRLGFTIGGGGTVSIFRIEVKELPK